MAQETTYTETEFRNLKDIDKKPKKKKRYWHCQAAEEMNPKCETQCDHCERYYAPIDDPK